jgi:CheY-like chemotaxis protein
MNGSTAPSKSKPLVLVVDDQPANIQVLYALLKDDYDVCMALNGADALGICRAQRPVLVLLDIEMPGMGGYEMCRQLKDDPALRGTTVIFASGHLDPHVQAQGIALGAAGFISKPYTASVVREMVRSSLALS